MGDKLRNVLVVEDENVLRVSMVAGLAKLKGTQVLGAGTLGEAIANLDAHPPSVVVSDIDLPDGLGVQLIGELAKRRIAASVIFVTAYRTAYGSLIPPNAGVEVLEKPVSLDTIRRVVGQRLGDDVASSPFTVADYVQLSCMGHRSVTIDIESSEGQGKIEIVEGVLWSAIDELGATGEPAFRRLAFRSDVKIQCTAAAAAPGVRNIASSSESALMEAARLLDEGARDSHETFDTGASNWDDFGEIKTRPPASRRASAPAMPAVSLPSPQAAPDAPADDPFDVVFDQAIAALMRKDYAAAAAAFGRALAMRPDDPKTKANLKRLHEMGFEPEP